MALQPPGSVNVQRISTTPTTVVRVIICCLVDGVCPDDPSCNCPFPFRAATPTDSTDPQQAAIAAPKTGSKSPAGAARPGQQSWQPGEQRVLFDYDNLQNLGITLVLNNIVSKMQSGLHPAPIAVISGISKPGRSMPLIGCTSTAHVNPRAPRSLGSPFSHSPIQTGWRTAC